MKFPADVIRQRHSKRRGCFQAKALGCTTQLVHFFFFFTFQSQTSPHWSKLLINTLKIISIAWTELRTGSVLVNWCRWCHWRESSRGQECERMSLCLWMAWSKSRDCLLIRTSIQPLYGADTSVDTRGTSEWERRQHASVNSETGCLEADLWPTSKY